MEIRIVSDLHLDVNKAYYIDFVNTDQFTIVCGDCGGELDRSFKWLDKNVKNGLIVEGNHILYNRHALEESQCRFQSKYPNDSESRVSFLECGYKVIDDVVFIGATLWFNGNLFGKGRSDKLIVDRMNDFRWGKVLSSDDPLCVDAFRLRHVYGLHRSHYNYIKRIVKRFADKKVVVITHHAPSIKSVPFEYKEDLVSAAYASNLERFIISHPNIKLWCHGHVHSRCDYMLGECRVVCNSRGYCEYKEDVEFDKNFTVEI